jgi:molybdate transport system ATP-binding protein
MTKPNSKIIFRASKMLHTSHGSQALDIAFELGKGRLLTLYGSSGAGKTTILRILAGLTGIDSGYIEVDGEVWCDKEKKINIPARKRSIGLVFQDFALFPHLTVKEQLTFALPKGGDKTIVTELIELMELTSLQNRLPALLSGGQQQRVALARAIARRPGLLLLDEPLSALDDEMRFRLQDYILKAHRHYHLTTILVSHYLPEIFRLSDEVICLEKGRILKQGAPQNIFLEEKISGKFKVTGEIISIVKADIVYIVSILCANNIVKVIATEDEIPGLHTGQKVMVASKAFNPVIIKME